MIYPRHQAEFAILEFAPHARLTVGDARMAHALLGTGAPGEEAH
jgi:hypothetical protein